VVVVVGGFGIFYVVVCVLFTPSYSLGFVLVLFFLRFSFQSFSGVRGWREGNRSTDGYFRLGVCVCVRERGSVVGGGWEE